MSGNLLNLPTEQAHEAAKPFMDRLGDLPVPTPEQVLDKLQHIEVYQAAILLLVGIVYMLWGWKIFKFLVTVNLAAVGALLGSSLGAMHNPQWSMYGALIGAAVLAILAWPLMKFAVSLMGASAGAFAGYHLWHYFTVLYRHEWVQYSWAGGLAGLLLLGAMTFVLFRTVIMLFTSLQGAVLTVAGGVALVLHHEPWQKDARNHLLHDPHLMPLLVIVPAIVGLIFQALSLARKKSPSASPQEKAAAK